MQKTEIPGLYKESEGVLINADKEALMNYKKRRELLLAKDKRINTLETRMDKISEDMKEIKSLLRKLTKE